MVPLAKAETALSISIVAAEPAKIDAASLKLLQSKAFTIVKALSAQGKIILEPVFT
jgi:hypothetical protein